MKRAILLAALLNVVAPAAAELDVDAQSVLLLSSETHDGGPYERTVMIAAPVPSGGHAGVVLNRPSSFKLETLFPEFAPAKNVLAPLYLGGHHMKNAVVAVVTSVERPSVRALSLAPDVWLVIDAAAIDKIIEDTPNAARYYVGLILWGEGKLRMELDQGEVTALPVDASKLFLPDTSKLYDELAPAGPRPAGARSARSGDGVFDLAAFEADLKDTLRRGRETFLELHQGRRH